MIKTRKQDVNIRSGLLSAQDDVIMIVAYARRRLHTVRTMSFSSVPKATRWPSEIYIWKGIKRNTYMWMCLCAYRLQVKLNLLPAYALSGTCSDFNYIKSLKHTHILMAYSEWLTSRGTNFLYTYIYLSLKTKVVLKHLNL